MRQLLRWTFNTWAAASLLLCLATAGLWVRSYWVYDRFSASRPEAPEPPRRYYPLHYNCSVCAYEGRFFVWIGWSERLESRPAQPWKFEIDHPTTAVKQDWTVYKFLAERQVLGGAYALQSRGLGVRAWSLVSAFALLPAIVTFRQIRAARRRRHRSRLGLCRVCGYDLRASPDRCPECGAAPRDGTIPAAEAAR